MAPERKHRKGCHSPETGALHSRSGPHQGNHYARRLEPSRSSCVEKLDTADVQARKAYLRSVIAQIEAGDGKSKYSPTKLHLPPRPSPRTPALQIFAVLYAVADPARFELTISALGGQRLAELEQFAVDARLIPARMSFSVWTSLSRCG
jgi:hypothetical protein